MNTNKLTAKEFTGMTNVALTNFIAADYNPMIEAVRLEKDTVC